MNNASYRIEKDFLGEKQVPAEAYYGIQTLRAQENFPITGNLLDTVLIQNLALVKKAAAMANYESGLLSKTIANAICAASDDVLAGKHHKEFIVDPIQGGAGTSINMNANEVLANIALEKLGKEKGDYAAISPNSHVNMSQSTNDALPTAVRLTLLKKCRNLLSVYSALQEALMQKSVEFDDVIKMGRTHLQDAVPIRLGQEFLSYATVLSRDIRRLTNSFSALEEVNMGATAVGTGLNANAAYIQRVVAHLATLSGEKVRLVGNLIDGTQNTDTYTQLSSCLKIGMINLSKIGNDLRLMASGSRAGLYEIQLPARQPGSSIMPGKVNPVMVEVINQIAFQVIGNDQTICLASEAGQFELNVMEPVLFFNLFQSLNIMTNGLRVFCKYCINGIVANKKTMLNYVKNSVGIVTAISPHIGYEAASKIAREAMEDNLSVQELILKYELLTKEELDVILNPYEMTEVGISGYGLLKNKQNNKEIS